MAALKEIQAALEVEVSYSDNQGCFILAFAEYYGQSSNNLAQAKAVL